MSTYLLTWNPEGWDWTDLTKAALSVKAGQLNVDRWSTGVRKTMKPGDHLFLIRLGVEPKGIMGSGYAISNVYEDEHWSNDTKGALYVDLEWEILLNPESDELLNIDQLREPPLDKIHWTPQSSGTKIPDELAPELEQRWLAHLNHIGYEGEEEEEPPLEERIAVQEGNGELVLHLKRERHNALRDQKLIAAKLLETKLRCEACGTSFSDLYNEIGDDFIEVHHKYPISKGPRQSTIDDLALLCSNCHRMIHKTPFLSDIQEFKNRYVIRK